MPSSEEIRAARLGDAYQAQTEALRARVDQFVVRTWGSLSSWRDEDVAAFVARILPVVQGAQVQMSSLTDSFLATWYTLATGEKVPPTRIPPAAAVSARGVDPATVYQRPFQQVWWALSKGAQLADAVQQGQQRLQSIASTDLALAKRQAEHVSMSGRDDVVGYRRLLEGSRNCALCVVASTQRYRKGQLRPIHGGCDCGVQPIIGRFDPGRVLNQRALDDAHELVKAQFGADAPDYRDVLITREHGELGPVLTVRNQKFTGPDDVSAPNPTIDPDDILAPDL